MYSSDLNVAFLISEVMSEISVFPRIEADKYFTWYNDIINILYGEIIRDNIMLDVELKGNNVPIASITVPKTTGTVLPQDIDKIYIVSSSGKRRFISKTYLRHVGTPFDNTYYTDGENIYINSSILNDNESFRLAVYAIYKPAPVSAENASEIKVPLPPEFHDIIVARLRGEAYKLCNEDGIAAKWLNEYNALAEDFKVWHHRRKPVL